MKASVVTGYGAPETVQFRDVATPEPGPGQVRVAVRAAVVQPVDAVARQGLVRHLIEPARPPFTVGWDAAGVVDAVGEGVDAYRAGDAVVAFSQWFTGGHVGTHAEHVVLDVGNLAPAPAGVPWARAATIPLNGLTTRQSLDVTSPQPGETLLVTGAAGAIGRFTIELLRGSGVRIVALAREHDRDELAALGADDVVTGLDGVDPVDVVIDAAQIGDALEPAVRDGGRVVSLGAPSALTPTRGIEVTLLMVRPDAAQLQELSDAAAAGRITLPVAREFALADAAAAHRLVDDGGLRGRVVLTV